MVRSNFANKVASFYNGKSTTTKITPLKLIYNNFDLGALLSNTIRYLKFPKRVISQIRVLPLNRIIIKTTLTNSLDACNKIIHSLPNTNYSNLGLLVLKLLK